MFFNMFFKHKTVDQVVSSLSSLCAELKELRDERRKEAQEWAAKSAAANQEADRAERVSFNIDRILN